MNKKSQHFTRIILSYIAYESNSSSPVTTLKYFLLLAAFVVLSSII